MKQVAPIWDPHIYDFGVDWALDPQDTLVEVFDDRGNVVDHGLLTELSVDSQLAIRADTKLARVRGLVATLGTDGQIAFQRLDSQMVAPSGVNLASITDSGELAKQLFPEGYAAVDVVAGALRISSISGGMDGQYSRLASGQK